MSKKIDKRKIQVSIIVPVYNIEKYVSKCLESVINQTLDKEEYEIIIVDDSSTDEGLNLCKKKIKDFDNVKIVEHKKNMGLGSARNTGIKEANGEYLYFIDGDDYIDKSTLENLLKLAEKHKADIVTAGFKRVNENGDILFEENDYSNLVDDKYENLKIMLADQVTHTAWGKLVKKSIFIDNDIWYPKGIHEDIPVTYLLFWYADKIYVSDEISYYWVKRESSITSYMSKGHIDGWFGAIEGQKKFVIKNFKNKELLELNKMISQGLEKAKEKLMKNIEKYEKGSKGEELKKYLLEKYKEQKYF